MKGKVLLISPQPFFQWRGSPIRVGFNLLALTDLDYSVDLLTLPIGEEKETGRARVIRVANPFRMKNIPIGPSPAKIVFDILILFKGIKLVLKNRYDVVHGIEETGIIACLLARLIGAKAVFEKHSDPYSYKKGVLKNLVLRVYAAVERLTVRLADAVIGTGPGLVNQVNEMKTGTRAFHIFDIPSSLIEPSPEKTAAIRDDLLQDKSEVLITFVGSFAVYQGVDLMFAAMPKVIRSCPEARFVIIGGNEGEIEAQRLRFRGMSIEHAVTFLGKIAPDLLPDYLAASDILLSPRSSGVNTPLKLLDYLKAGRAVVATDIASNKLILDGRTAVLAAPDPESFSSAITTLVKDGQHRQRLGAAGHVLYLERYNFLEYTKRLAACYKYVLDEPSLKEK